MLNYLYNLKISKIRDINILSYKYVTNIPLNIYTNQLLKLFADLLNIISLLYVNICNEKSFIHIIYPCFNSYGMFYYQKHSGRKLFVG